jgi:hypothetical protein
MQFVFSPAACLKSNKGALQLPSGEVDVRSINYPIILA